MDSNAGKGKDHGSERDTVWGVPFGRRRQDLTAGNSGSSQLNVSSDNNLGHWRCLTADLPSEPTSAAYNNHSNDNGGNSATPPRSTSRLNPTRQQAYSALNPRQQLTHPSATAASRTQVYNNQQKPVSSYMKQSCLPVEERDPILELAEQNKGRRIAEELYKPGMIVHAPLHEPFLSGATDNNDRTRTESIFGPVFTKMRKMIVVALYHDHYTALPLYTHKGNGLQAKAKPDEYVSVRDHRMQGPFTPLSKHLALVTETMNLGTTLMHPKATAHLTYPVSRKYDLPVRPVGQLDKSSTRSLIALYLETIPRPLKA